MIDSSIVKTVDEKLLESFEKACGKARQMINEGGKVSIYSIPHFENTDENTPYFRVVGDFNL